VTAAVVSVSLFFAVTALAMAGVGAPDPRWIPCASCKHLRIEHRRDGKSCEVRSEDEHQDRCDCRGFRPKAGAL